MNMNKGEVVLIDSDLIGLVTNSGASTVEVVPIARLHERVSFPLARAQTLDDYDKGVIEARQKSAAFEAQQKADADAAAGLAAPPSVTNLPQPAANDQLQKLLGIMQQQQQQIADLLASAQAKG